MEPEDSSMENKDLSSYLKTKRKLFWVRRFFVVKSGILYYYKNATVTVPRGIIHLEGATILRDPRELVIDISKEKTSSLKIQFPNQAEFNLWFNQLSISAKTSEKNINQGCYFNDLQKSVESENASLIDQIPKTSMQTTYSLKIKEITERDYKIVGTKGTSIFACAHLNSIENKVPEHDTKTLILLQFLVFEVISHVFGFIIALALGVLYIGYIYSMKNLPTDKPVVDNKFHFRCTTLIRSGIGEILTALHDTYCRQAWEPYLTDCNESTSIKLTYNFKSVTYTQELHRVFLKESPYFYLIEKVGPEIKNLFKIEPKTKHGHLQCQVSHFGSLSANENPLIGNSELLAGLKLYVESTTVYVSTTEVPRVLAESDEEEINESIILSTPESDEHSKYNIEALRVLKEAQSLLDITEGWEDLKIKSQFIKGYRKKANGGLYVIRGEGVINRSPAEIVEALKDISRKAGYDSMFESGYSVETINDSMEIVYQKYKSKGPVSARDFCLLQKRFDLPGGKVVAVATSIVHEKCPETKFVRAHLFMGCHFLTPTGPNTTMDVYMVHVDIKGSVPKFILNSVQNDQAMLVENLKNFVN